MIIYDEIKRQTNLLKHGLDLLDATLVYHAPNKVTLESPRGNEARLMDIALVEVMGGIGIGGGKSDFPAPCLKK